MSSRFEPEVDLGRYNDEQPAQKYTDLGSRDNEKLFNYRHERQLMGTQQRNIPFRRVTSNPQDGQIRQVQNNLDEGEIRRPDIDRNPSRITSPASRSHQAESMGVSRPVKEPTGLPVIAGHFAKTSDESFSTPISEVLATCVHCLSSNSMTSTQEGIFCSTCNKAALIPRVGKQIS